jgi:Ca-activated chloride channel homolog
MDVAGQPVGTAAVTFARPDLLPFAVVVPALLAVATWLYARRRRRIAGAFSDPHLLERLGGEALHRFPVRTAILVTAVGAFLAFAAAGPRWGVRAMEGRAVALNIVFAADVSKSMLAEDLEPNRLERARLFARRLLRELPGDRVGLVAFAGRAYVLSPLTVDQSAIQLYIDALDPYMMSDGGSSLAAALNQATDLVRASDAAGDRVVVLLSDGEETVQDIDAIRAAADRTARAGVRVIAVGVGTSRGTTVPVTDPVSGRPGGVTRDEYGQVVVSRLDEQALRTIAGRTDGQYVRLDDAAAVDQVLDALRAMQRAESDGVVGVQARDRFALFAFIALLLLAADTLVGARRLRPAGGRRRVTAGGEASARRAAATAALLALAAGTGFGIGDLERGNRMYREGRYEEAAQAYQRALDRGRSEPELHYNMGTALLALGRHAEADQHFEEALRSVDPEVRIRSFYNAGNRFLVEGRGEGDLRRQADLLDAAIEAYRRALRIEPGDLDAKWNLELALREREENAQRQQSMPDRQDQDQESGEDDQDEERREADGTGSGASPSSADSGEGGDDGTSQQDMPMSEEEADRILNAMEQDERELAREKLQRGQRRTPVRRDW